MKDTIYDDSIPLDERNAAVQELGNLAETGNPYAQYLMGKLWRDGPLSTPDWVNARHWFKRAAQQGHIVAQYALGNLYLSDDVEVRAPLEGLRWLETAAQNDSHYAAYRLGKEYLKGEVAEKDIPKALEYLNRSAEAGNQFAQYMLGKLYLIGREIPYDKELAIHWLTQSSNQGNEYAKFFLERQEDFRPPPVMLSVTRLLHHMGRIFQENALPKSRPGGIQIDRKRLQKLREKKMAQGHKRDDHEEQNWTMSM